MYVCTHAPPSIPIGRPSPWTHLTPPPYPLQHPTALAATTSGDSTRGAMDDDHARVRWWQRGLAAKGAEGGHAMNVFAMALSGMDQVEIGWMMVAVIFSQLRLDEVLRRVEASVGPNARACLREVYKELSTVRGDFVVLVEV